MLWGNRIGLRPFADELTDDEIAQVYRWSKDTLVLRWSGGSPTELTLAEFGERLRSEQQHPLDNRIAFFIFTRALDAKQNASMIGRIGIFAIDWEKHEGELGIVIGEPAAWDKHFGREAITLLLRHLFETTLLERITLYTFVDNQRAQKCFAACGFRSLGAARRFSPDLGEFDGVEMEITRAEFLAQPKSPNYFSISIEQDAT
jgi:RimJ/RimL family protein N-acetyltransferase